MTIQKITPIAPSEQHSAVMQLLAETKYRKDAEDEAGYVEVWARNARLTIHSSGRQIGPIVGRAAIMDFYRNSWARNEHGTDSGRETHVAEHPFIEPNGKHSCRAIHSAIFTAMDGKEPVLIGFGTFTDDIVFEDGRWRILERVSNINRR